MNLNICIRKRPQTSALTIKIESLLLKIDFQCCVNFCCMAKWFGYTDRASLVAQIVKNMPSIQEIWVQSLGWEDPLEKEMATHSSSLAWRVLWTEEPGRLQSTGLQRVVDDWVTNTFIILWGTCLHFLWAEKKQKGDTQTSLVLQPELIFVIFCFFWP